MQARDSAAFQNINPLFNKVQKDDAMLSLMIKELQTELQQLRQQNEILKKQLELKDEMLDKKSTQIISYASENIQYEKEIEKLKKELSIYKQLHLEDHLFIPTTDSSIPSNPNNKLSKKNKRARSKSKSIKSHKKQNQKRKATKLKQARSYDKTNSALGYMEIDSIDEQTALSFSKDAKQIEQLASPQSSPDFTASSPEELPYFMPSISTNLSGCSDLSAQACKLSLPPCGIRTALNGVIMERLGDRGGGGGGRQMDVDDDDGFDSPLGPSPSKRLEYKDSNPPPFLPKKPLLRILSPIAEHNVNDVEELNSFTLDGTRSDISSTNVTPIPNDIDIELDTRMDMDTPMTSPELGLRNSDANSNIGDEWNGMMAEIESDMQYVNQQMSIEHIALNDFQVFLFPLFLLFILCVVVFFMMFGCVYIIICDYIHIKYGQL